MKTKLEKSLIEAMTKDLKNWKGLFYYNKKDPRLIVPKFNPKHGWTFNFASPYSYITLGATIIITIIYIIITK